jgi:hypothetical protein
VVNGVFNVQLGTSTPLSPADFQAPRYLSVQAGADPEMNPRVALASVPTALRAEVSESLVPTASVASRQSFVGSPVSGCELRTVSGFAQVYCPDAVGTMRKCLHANEIATQPTCGITATPSACTTYCVDAGQSKTVTIGKFIFERSGSYAVELDRGGGVACVRYNNMASRTVTTSLLACNNTPNNCTASPLTLATSSATAGANPTTTIDFVDSTLLESGPRDFTLAASPAPDETRMSLRLSLSQGAAGNNTVCFLISRNTAVAAPDPLLRVQLDPTRPFATW